ncbi:MAG: sulfotransferase family protein [Gemmatimonadales bacterium]
MTLPNFVLIGAAKSGTSSLFAYLGQHPDVFISPTKEPNFFALAGQQVTYRGPGDVIINQASVTRLADYQALFKGVKREAAVGEASNLYLYLPAAPEAIAHHLPDVRLIAILRDPAERAYSSYLHMRRDGREPCDSFEAALEEEAARVSQNWEPLWHYTGLGFYHAQLREYYGRFPRERIAVYLYDDFEADPQRVVRELFTFLGVDPSFEPDMSVRHKVSGTPRSRALHAILTRPNPAKALAKRLMPTGLRGQLYGAVMQRNIREERHGLRDDTRRTLQRLYQADVQRLSQLIGRDLSRWLANGRPQP